MEVKLASLRLAFPVLFEPKPVGNDGEPRFSAAFPIAPGSENAEKLEAAVQAVAKEKWKDKAAAILAELEGKGRVCYQKRPLSKDGEVYDGFEGQHSLNASNKARPLVINSDKSPLTAVDGKVYGGCYVHVAIDVWAQDNSWGKRINATLKTVRFFKDGDAFSGARSGTANDLDEFDSLEAGADADALV